MVLPKLQTLQNQFRLGELKYRTAVSYLESQLERNEDPEVLSTLFQEVSRCFEHVPLLPLN